MHARESVELAAFVAAEGSTLLRSVRRISPESMAQYWIASKCRLDRWGRALREFRQRHLLALGTRDAETSWSSIHGVCEEVLATEMLTRTWSCIVLSIEDKLGGKEAQPLVASVLSGHLEATNRVLNLLSLEGVAPSRSAAELNRLRRLVERWTDMLLGRLGLPLGFSAVAYDAGRAQDFADDFAYSGHGKSATNGWALLTASLRATFAKRLRGDATNADLNARIAGAILACFPAEMFDSIGVYHSLWQSRLCAMTCDTQVLVDELLDADRPRRFR
jgi:hypothetical protein